MARVNIEEELFAGNELRKLGRFLGSEHLALGYLSFLWRDSQQDLCIGGNKTKIFDWLRVVPSAENEKIITILIECGFLKQTSDDFYEIRGNQKQIDNRIKKLKASRKGAVSTQKKWRDAKKEIGPSPGHQASHHQAITTLNSIQFSAIQSNSSQVNSRTTIAPQVRKTFTYGAITNFSENESVRKSLENVKQETQKLWCDVYKDDKWINQEILKALTWISANPQKAPKKIDRFISNWLSKGWEQYRKTIPSNAPSHGDKKETDPETMRIEMELAKWTT